jgi:MFS family permease
MVDRRSSGGFVGWLEASQTVLALCLVAYFATRLSQAIIGPIVPLVIEEFAVSRGDVGIVLTGMWIGYALSQLPSGHFADRFGERRVVLFALGIAAVATVGLSVTPTFLGFAAATVGLGIGAGAYYNPATALLTRTFDAVGSAIGIHRVGGQIAGVAAPVVAAAVGVRYGWRAAVGVGGVLVVVSVSLFSWRGKATVPTRPDASVRELFDLGTLVEMLREPTARNTTLITTLANFVELATMAFLPVFLVEQYSFSIGRANLFFAFFFSISAVFQPLGGRISDRIGRIGTVAALSVAGLFGYGMLALGRTVPVAVVGIGLAGASLSVTPVLQARMMDVLDAEDRGIGFGLFRTVYLLVGSTGTAAVGTAADVVGWTPAFGLLTSFWGVVLCLLLWARIGSGRS